VTDLAIIAYYIHRTNGSILEYYVEF